MCGMSTVICGKYSGMIRLFVACLLVVSVTAHAQYIPMTTHTTYRTPTGNVSVPFTTMTPMPGSTGSTRIGKEPRICDVTIRLKPDSVRTTDSTFTVKININAWRARFLKIREDGSRATIRPNQTKSLTITNENGRTIVGTPTDSCWLFKCFYGKINGYSFYPDEEKKNTVAIQKGYGTPILPLTHANVATMLAACDDRKVISLLKKGRLLKAIERYNFLP